MYFSNLDMIIIYEVSVIFALIGCVWPMSKLE
jgi:hypothetical protein